jgi:multisubunit Na+/H+ antiporter MnhC subunit
MYAAKIAMQMVSNGNNDLIFTMGDSTGGSGASCTS